MKYKVILKFEADFLEPAGPTAFLAAWRRGMLAGWMNEGSPIMPPSSTVRIIAEGYERVEESEGGQHGAR